MSWAGFGKCCCRSIWWFHSCECSRHKNEKRRSTCECIWVLLILCIFIFTLIWMYITLIIENDMHNFNEYIFKSRGFWVDWFVVLVTVTAVLLTYCSILLMTSMCLVACAQPLKLHCLHKVLVCLCAAIVILLIVFLDLKWKEEWDAVSISLQSTSPFLHIGAVIGMSAFSWVLAGYFWSVNNKVLKYLLLAAFVILVGALYVSPLFISSPCIIEASKLPPKPKLNGHRGAPMLAPENTMMSFDKMAALGTKVFETDVMVSWDGIPFLMHDSTLLRTTDVAQVFPERAKENCSNFEWTDLQKLNAGNWFLQRNPFNTMGSLTDLDIQEVKRQKIPTLNDLLNAAEKENISVLFDLRPPPAGHPHNESYVNITLRTILNSTIRQELILWLPDEERENVIAEAPGFRQIYGRKRTKNETFDFVNLSYRTLSVDEIRSYRKDNVSVNLYVVNKPWLFSYVWCAGATSVTTNSCHFLRDLQRPLWVLAPDDYFIIWILADCISFLHVVWAFMVQRKCMRKKEQKESETVLLMKLESLNY
ncbi:glycerophosphoinositol inositolphosphodiesterase GDPD2 [Spea bombifrons]|uniref:glycerophosphoinositol inositolphosphodiesterase GDPD2 n=1 Tax=Spea bombifrons TaxID=233779 RepID=UPI00234A4BDD|nr:glycerophosphoinositol inositolphosphodiesterase GDPD2 [Spea bombifrons]XP_053329618.1 glycerophosphoinositol inositolphosphodiesterase GDPD2 [Spea bombifrons]XP_053329620.1 glycerophosphoinositol inositolphosphodiesterase GDPD2 [Spea bombifrons]XP_053329621.1 glycerophosphoinositol inositolphosphodiesterase GDPD2 [Spea bombifrons]XP_053329622.1 glycerophosphoinositol inositolphosphodiesterase GDPD2 [Spea bombifrons]